MVASYDLVDAAEYERMDRVEAELWWYRALHARLIRALRGVRGNVLDAGCGTGGFLAALARARPDLALTGCEFDPYAATLARRKGNAAVVVGNVHDLPFENQQFDAVVSADVLCHAGVAARPALEEMRRVLRPGGVLVVNMPAYQWLFSEHDRRVQNVLRVSAGEMGALLNEAGFLFPRIRYWNGFLLPLMVLRRKVLAARAGAESDVAPVHKVLNAAFLTLLKIEACLRVPAGGSVMAVAVCP
jgi:SAM-dependent methyltransferase